MRTERGRGQGALDAGGCRRRRRTVAGGPAPLERVVCQLANEAAFAAGEGVAAPDDIDSAMRLGLNHPRGPFEWVRELGVGSVVATLDALRAQHDDERCDIAPLLRGPAKQ